MSVEQSRLPKSDRERLLDVAEQSIAAGLQTRRIVEPELVSYSDALRHVQASFVTLRTDEQLRGCVGSVEASDPLVFDVSHNAFRAAFNNGRYPALTEAEFPSLTIQVTVLSPLKHLITRSLGDVIAKIQPGVDGVVLRLGRRHAMFLPEIWETLQDPVELFRHLRLKAGLPPERWSPRIRVSTFQTQRFSRLKPVDFINRSESAAGSRPLTAHR
ncbi:AmmeMemoRadiSam system protein A [Novipirellula aureliae]|nr:AmmeMemoRadiSam system protein A [Novipirellula aureliae]